MTPHPTMSTPWWRRDAGSASVAIAIVFPAVALLFLALAQAVLVSVARDVALAAAEEGLRAARAHHGTPAQGRAAALAFARAEPVLQAPDTTVTGQNTIVVRVSGYAPSLLPGVRIDVTRTARGARERFTVPGQP
ncbi:pilus assembly protein [Actinomadura sp. WAC 06369]|uniref:pilus assembly protein n=1 Tax=Actinomadura sp. WAC 06369 TaxID=2203193 RepID=UPI000F76E3A8|nr:pilus assembly protein [Actinomadura sp. WAC 06369]